MKQKAIIKIKETLLPNENIQKIILIGSSVNNTFGEYDPPGFSGSLYSDFDFIAIVDDNYQIPDDLTIQRRSKTFF